MITDKETNTLYLADILPKLNPDFFSRFISVLDECKIQHSIIPHTKDIWAVDYMPIQIDINNFIRFIYNPQYLQTIKYRKTISDVDTICDKIGIDTTKSTIVLDGGNVTRTTDKVIMTDRIFQDNPTFQPKQLIRQLEALFQVDKLYFVPEQPKDFTGHSDGMIRFIDNHTVLVNNYGKEKEEFRRAFQIAILNIGLDYIELPYNPYQNTSYNQANGDYINYLQMEQAIVVPVFGIKEDEEAIRKFEEVFVRQTIATIESNEIANQGGILNCITWNIRTEPRTKLA